MNATAYIMKEKVFPCSNGTLCNNNIDSGETRVLPPDVASAVSLGHLQDGLDFLQSEICQSVNGSLAGPCANGQVYCVAKNCSAGEACARPSGSLGCSGAKDCEHQKIEDADLFKEENLERGGVVEIMAPPHSEEGAYRRVVFDSQARDLHVISNQPILHQPEDMGAELEQEEEESREHVNSIPTRLQVLIDPANLCTFSGALLAVLAMASMWTGRYYLGMFFNVAANIADIIDGPIARSTPHRHPAFSLVGSKLDCYADLVSHYVVPASLLMHFGELGLVPVLLGGIYVCSGIMRQSYFEVTGRCQDGTCIFGATSDYNVGIYTISMHLMPLIGQSNGVMLLVLYATILLMIFCSLTLSIRSRRYDGVDLVLVTVFNVLLCISCGFLALYSDSIHGLASISSVAFPILLITAYPLYFRHVEINR